MASVGLAPSRADLHLMRFATRHLVKPVVLLAVELAVKLTSENGPTHILSLVFFLVAVFFVWRSFYGMSIGAQKAGS